MLFLLSVITRPPHRAVAMPLWGRGVMLGVLALLILLLAWGIRSTLRSGTLAARRRRYGTGPVRPPTTREDNPFSYWSYVLFLLLGITLLLVVAVFVVLGALQQI